MRGWKAIAVVAGAALLVAINGLVLQRLLDLGGSPRVRLASGERLDERPAVRVGVISRYAPSLTYERYQPVMDYLSSRSPYRYELRLSTTYEDAAQQLRRGDVVASFFGTWIYARLGPGLGLEPVLAPRSDDGGTTFRAALVVPRSSPLATVADLRGRRVALPSRFSYAGNWLTAEALPATGLSLADLDSVHHFDYHQTVIHRVLDGQFDAGVVREMVAREFEAQGIRIIARSAPFPGAPLVVRSGRVHPAAQEMQRLLLALAPGETVASAQAGTWPLEFAHGFVAVNAATYERFVRLYREQAAR